jgi:hypothetical protein
MPGERIVRRPPAREGTHLRGRGCLLGRELILGRRGFELLELKLHLVGEPRLALLARAKQVALELVDRQPQVDDQRFRALLHRPIQFRWKTKQSPDRGQAG